MFCFRKIIYKDLFAKIGIKVNNMSTLVPSLNLISGHGALPMPILGYGTWQEYTPNPTPMSMNWKEKGIPHYIATDIAIFGRTERDDKYHIRQRSVPFQASDDILSNAIDKALTAGYRHIDTAHAYENEKVIGDVIKKWIDSGKLKREDIFLTTKLPPGGNRPEGVSKYLKRSLELLQMDYVDLYLVHTPFAFKDIEGQLHPFTADGRIDMDVNTDHIAIWKAMEEQVDKGLTKSIGISNFNKSQISRILNNARIKPCSLQIELHAYNQQNDLVQFCNKNNIVVTAYSPLGNPGLSSFLTKFGQTVNLPNVMLNPTVQDLAKKYNKTGAQILLKHTVQRGICAIPKSTNPERLKQNIDIFNFTLDDQDMAAMNKLDQGVRLLDFSLFNGIKEHPEYPFPELK